MIDCENKKGVALFHISPFVGEFNSVSWLIEFVNIQETNMHC